MKVLVTGANGQLGSILMALGTQENMELIGLGSKDLDITNQQQVDEIFQSHKFDYCVNCAAYTAVDQAETDQEACRKANEWAVANLAKACASHETRLIHISTDFVFNAKHPVPLKESDTTDPINYYGLSKQAGELAVAKHLSSYLIIRTSWLYHENGHNFLNTMLRLASSKTELNVVIDQIGTPTYAEDLARDILTIINQNRDKNGIYHYSNEGVASWYDFAKAIFEFADIDITVNPVGSDAFPTPAKRPHYSVMDKSKIKSDFGLQLPHWRESLKKCINKR